MDGGPLSTREPERLRRALHWRLAYYLILSIWFVVVHRGWFADLVGDSTATWLWKANEAYLVALVVPLFWDLVATRTTLDGAVELVGRSDRPSPLTRRVLWYGVIVLSLAFLEGPLSEAVFGRRPPQRILTLRDVIAGLLGLSLYFDWSRGLWRSLRGEQPRLVSGRARLWFFIAVLAVNVAIFQEPVKELLGFRISNALDFHAEGFAVLFYVPLYFDVVLPLSRGDGLRAVAGPSSPSRGLVLASWIAVMSFFVWFGQGAARDLFDNSFGQWFVRSPEPAMAAFGFTLYFERLRRLDGVANRRHDRTNRGERRAHAGV